MELRLLAYVVAIAEEGSISGAARRLHLTQPTLSRQLRETEDRLGVVLFARQGRGLAPTPAGEVLVRRAVTLLAEAESTLRDVRLAAQGMSGHLTVTFAGSGINGPLGGALSRVRRELPRVELQLQESFNDAEMSAGVLDGRFDLAVQRLPMRDARLSTQVWWQEPLTLFLPAGHPLAQSAEPAPLAALGQIPLVVWPRDVSPAPTTRSSRCATARASCRRSARRAAACRRCWPWSPPGSVPPCSPTRTARCAASA